MTRETSENLRNAKEVRSRIREFGRGPCRPLSLLDNHQTKRSISLTPMSHPS